MRKRKQKLTTEEKARMLDWVMELLTDISIAESEVLSLKDDPTKVAELVEAAKRLGSLEQQLTEEELKYETAEDEGGCGRYEDEDCATCEYERDADAAMALNQQCSVEASDE